MLKLLMPIAALVLLVTVSAAGTTLEGDMRVSVDDYGMINSIYVSEPLPHDGFVTGYAPGVSLLYPGLNEFWAISSLQWGELIVRDPLLGYTTTVTSSGSIRSVVTTLDFYPAIVSQTVSFPVSGPDANTVSIDVSISNPTVHTLHDVRYGRGLVPAAVILGIQEPVYSFGDNFITAHFEAEGSMELNQDITFILMAEAEGYMCLNLFDDVWLNRETNLLTQPTNQWDGVTPRSLIMSAGFYLGDLGPGETMNLHYEYAATVPEPAAMGLMSIGLMVLFKRTVYRPKRLCVATNPMA